ncbi:MAG: hypothetical protein ACK5A2_08635 [Bacteroidota bacterium]|jgi:hypothetical protein
MTPKEKAIELFNKYSEYEYPKEVYKFKSKRFAIIAVDLLISETFLDFYVTHPKPFWEEVKTELEKL